MNYGTWNVQGIRRKMEEITSELGNLKMDVIGLTETKRKGIGTEIVRDYVHLYSGVPEDRRAEKGVSILIKKKFKKRITNWEAVNENITVNINHLGTKITVLCVYALSNDKANLEKDQFYEKLIETLVNIGTTREIILLGEFNGHTGKKANNQVVGPYGETRVNDNGERLIDLC
jgi:exonuclease III